MEEMLPKEVLQEAMEQIKQQGLPVLPLQPQETLLTLEGLVPLAKIWLTQGERLQLQAELQSIVDKYYRLKFQGANRAGE